MSESRLAWNTRTRNGVSPICARFARMRWTLPQALRAMETDGWTRGGVATEEALCA